jgi:hypothetical protein
VQKRKSRPRRGRAYTPDQVRLIVGAQGPRTALTTDERELWR